LREKDFGGQVVVSLRCAERASMRSAMRAEEGSAGESSSCQALRLEDARACGSVCEVELKTAPGPA
jgi:hypothetical protein